MPVSLNVEHPEENEVSVAPRYLADGTGWIWVRGRGNRLTIADPFAAGDSVFELAGGAAVTVEAGCNLGGLQVHALCGGAAVTIGPRTSFNAVSQITVHEPARVTIGADCLFGVGCQISASDVHKVLDARTRARLNPAADIVIEDHVWVSPRTGIFRGAHVGRDSVVGFGSVVKGRFPPGVMLAGVPAAIVKRGITWEF